VVEPAIRHASRGFHVIHYLHECVSDAAADMALDPEISKLYLPDGAPIEPGKHLVTSDYANTLRAIVREGPSVLYITALSAHFTPIIWPRAMVSLRLMT
jgi:gamma-glutamyltranspeptidase/glutathione hydrolase